MIASKSAEFEALVLDAGVSFDDFGNATQGDVDDLKNQQFPGDLASRIKLQSIWARHPNRQGDQKLPILAHINLIKSLCFSMSHFISTIIIHHTVVRRMFHKIPIIDR
jgi:hypothetical protein